MAVKAERDPLLPSIFVLGLSASLGYGLSRVGFDFQTFYEIGMRARQGTLPAALEMLKLGLVYLPYFGLWMVPLTFLPWMIVWMLWIAAKWCCYAILFRWHWASTCEVIPAERRWLRRGWAFLPWIILLPAWTNELKIGQVNVFLLVLVALSFRRLTEQREWPAAWCYAISSFKTVPGIMVPYFAMRRRWSFLAKTALLVSLFIGSAILWWGPAGTWRLTQEWIGTSSWRQMRPEFLLAYSDQSLLAMTTRLLYRYGIPVWKIRLTAAAFSGVLVAVTLWVLRKPILQPRFFPDSDVAAQFLVMSLVSPNQAVSHRIWLIIPLFYIMRRCRARPANAWAWTALAIFVPFMLEGRDAVGARLFGTLHQASVYTGLMLVLWALVLYLGREERSV